MLQRERNGYLQDMIKNRLDDLIYYTFEKLTSFPEIKHGVFTRDGGISTGSCSGLNIGIVPNDSRDNVHKNRKLILKALDGDYIVSTIQTHGTNVFVSNGLVEDNIEADAIITDRNGATLLIKTADCQAVVLYDHVKKIIGNVHSGWRGSISNIVGTTVEAMKKEFGSNPKDIFAGIGPSLGPCCAEFKNFRDEIPEKYWSYDVGNNHFDFWKISIDQLREKGVPEENIEIGNICTKCNPDLFYSYRKERDTGRFGTVIMLKDL